MNNPMKSPLIAAALLILCPLTVVADSGFYVGASFGSANLTKNFDGLDVDSSSVAFRLTAGWQFNDYVSFEGGYHKFGDFEERLVIDGVPTDIRLNADGFTLGATGRLPLGERLGLFGRAGAFFWDGDAQINDVTQARPEDTNLYLGLGRELHADAQAVAGR